MSIDKADPDRRLPPLTGIALHDDDARPDPGRWVERAQRAEAAGLDFLLVEPGPPDAALVAALIAARTNRIGIVVRIATATTEPFHVSTQLATIDVVSSGRAGWLVDSWEDAAESRDVHTARFLDRDRVHHVDFRGQHIAVRGPSITPRPPQGHPVILADESAPELGADVVLGRDAVLITETGATGRGATGTLRERFGLPAATNRYAARA